MAPREAPEIVLNVLGYRDEDGWVALALEMDLRGYGETFEDALDDLVELVEMQISFALSKGQPGMVWRAAEPVWFERYAETRRARYLAFYSDPNGGADAEYRVRSMPIPEPNAVNGLVSSGFERLHA